MYHITLTGPADSQAAAEDALAEARIPHVAVVDGDVFLVAEHNDRDHVRALVAGAGWTVRGCGAGGSA